MNCDGGKAISSVLNAIQKGVPCRVRQSIFNPSFYAQIVIDDERMNGLRKHNILVKKHNVFNTEYEGGKNQKRYGKLTKLEDIFEDVALTLPSGEVKKLNRG